MFPVTETMSASAESADEEEWYHGKTAFSSLETEDEKAFSITGNYVPCYRKSLSATVQLAERIMILSQLPEARP